MEVGKLGNVIFNIQMFSSDHRMSERTTVIRFGWESPVSTSNNVTFSRGVKVTKESEREGRKEERRNEYLAGKYEY